MPLGAAAIATIAGGALSTGTGIFQSISAGNRAKEAQDAIDNYHRQNLTNPFENLQVSTMGADLQRQDLARSIASFSQNAALGGSRAIVGLVPNALNQQIGAEQKIAADLNQQYTQNQQLAAQGAGQIQQMQEARDAANLAGLGNSLNNARQEGANGFNNIAQGAMGVLSAAASGVFDPNKTPDPNANGSQGVHYDPNYKRYGTTPSVQVQAQPQLPYSPIFNQQPSYLNSKLGGAIQPAWMNLFPSGYAGNFYKN